MTVRPTPVLPTLLLLVVSSAPPAAAEIRPSFDLDLVAWEATDVVVVTEGEVIDGQVVVLESWRGDLGVGDTLSLPELAVFQDPESRTVHPSLFSFLDDDPPRVERVSGARMVLFLVRSGELGSAWEPASRDGFGGDDFRFSTTWVEAGQVFGFMQWVNPGPSQLTDLPWPEDEMLDRVAERGWTRAELDEVLAIPDRSLRARWLRDLAVPEVWEVRRDVFDALGECGPPAVPVLLEMAYDPELLGSHDDAVRALAEAGGPEAAEALVEIVRRDTELWRADASGLAEGWWNDLSDPTTKGLRERYGRTLTAVWMLRREEIRGAAARRSVLALRELWRSNPALGGPGSQIDVDCGDYLDDPPATQSPPE